jgi:Cdc6-like AAA superfamily ATPase
MAEWFGLREQHQDFTVDNGDDAALLFARIELNERLMAILRRSFRSRKPPKLVLYGDWGVGKTHTMRHLQYVIDNNKDFAAETVFVELPDITARSTFQVAHAALLDALGVDRAKSWMIQFQGRHQSNAIDLLKGFTQSADTATAFASLMGFGEVQRIAWDWLRGIHLSAADARLAGLPPSLDQSQHMCFVLQALGMLSREIEGKMLILMIDEVEKIEKVTQGDAINHWLNAFKVLADKQQKDVGLILAASFRDPDDAPTQLREQQVRTRFDEEHYIELQNFDERQTEVFTKDLLGEWVDSEKRQTLIDEWREQAKGEDVDGTFPFTAPGLAKFVQFAVRRGGVSTPRDVQADLDDILNSAIDDKLHIISGEYVHSFSMGVR